MAASLKEMRQFRKKALKKNDNRSKLKIHFIYAQFNANVLDNEYKAHKCYQQIRLIHSMKNSHQISREVALDDEQGLVIISGSLAKLGIIKFANSSICMLLRHK